MDQLKKSATSRYGDHSRRHHTVVGVLLQTDPDVDASWKYPVCLAISAYLRYAAFGTCEEQANWAVVLCGPIWVWFVVCGALELEGVGNNRRCRRN